MKFNLSNLSAVLLASGMLMSTAVTAAPGDATQFGGADTDWSTVDYPRGSLIWMTTLIQWGENPLYWPCSESYL